ncbi:MAG: NrfD/PsrC family molybdoenzyme membrane anchor subunit [Gemmatimonadota bacterium]|nr:NrfD/PsrC family molybdoenzyme membrane anchor subunit [Gemmatimonadota bacterium]
MERAISAATPPAGTGIRGFLRFLRAELRPKGPIWTPFNVITGGIMLLAAGILVVRFAFGLGSVTNLSQDFPWGIWKGFNVITGVAFAGGAYVLCFMVYIMKLEKYHPIVRVTVLNGFLSYTFYAIALVLELGRPWNILNPIIGNSFGVSSVLFLVAWHFLLYITAQFVEFSPTIAEWAGWPRLRRILGAMTLGAVVFGICLSMLHQSGLGALYLMAKTKVHPLWWNEFIPILFLVSSVFAGLSMVMIEGSLSRRVFRGRLGRPLREGHEEILYGLARISAGAILVYLVLQVVVQTHQHNWGLLATGWGAWYLLEILGLTLVPALLFLGGVRRRRISWVRAGAVVGLVGVVLNRMNVSIIAYRWDAPVHYVPTWMEVVVAVAVICAQIWVFRWVINRMPVLDFAMHGEQRETTSRRPRAAAAA